VSDAACVLGYFNPDYFLGGRMKLDVEAARRAVAAVAVKIGKSVEATAYGILSLASDVMIKAIEDITIAEGINPRDSVIVAGGGAAGLNIMLIARELGCQNVLVPKQASALSACGMQFADIVTEETGSLFTTSATFDAPRVMNMLASLDASLAAFRAALSDSQGERRCKIEHFAQARYASQVWEIEMILPNRDLTSGEGRSALFEAFHQTHERLFALRDEGSTIEFISWKARLTAETGVKLAACDGMADECAQAHSADTRRCSFGDDLPIHTRTYKAEHLVPGASLVGPCIIEEATTTVVLFPNMSAQVTSNGHYLLTFQ
jgi:N-methylhydantoinase A